MLFDLRFVGAVEVFCRRFMRAGEQLECHCREERLLLHPHLRFLSVPLGPLLHNLLRFPLIEVHILTSGSESPFATLRAIN